ncbi:hypothetical protein GN958_ATG04306 [Phytophthora infestans]|uniref:Uncharacterized protein n=1 Tax=Phytophthora infestans TaxID=4787 RepID=A0A8S9V1Q4_PHYIN|nr:hypothetical protein GN958_ATG04306 [Phytophthora infestans]
MPSPRREVTYGLEARYQVLTTAAKEPVWWVYRRHLGLMPTEETYEEAGYTVDWMMLEFGK